MSMVANYGLIILTPTLIIETSLSHPLHTACPFNQGKRKKPNGKNPPLNMDSKTKFENIVINQASQNDQQSIAVI